MRSNQQTPRSVQRRGLMFPPILYVLLIACGGSEQAAEVIDSTTLNARQTALVAVVARSKQSSVSEVMKPVNDVLVRAARRGSVDRGWGLVNFLEVVDLTATAEGISLPDAWDSVVAKLPADPRLRGPWSDAIKKIDDLAEVFSEDDDSTESPCPRECKANNWNAGSGCCCNCYTNCDSRCKTECLVAPCPSDDILSDEPKSCESRCKEYEK